MTVSGTLGLGRLLTLMADVTGLLLLNHGSLVVWELEAPDLNPEAQKVGEQIVRGILADRLVDNV